MDLEEMKFWCYYQHIAESLDPYASNLWRVDMMVRVMSGIVGWEQNIGFMKDTGSLKLGLKNIASTKIST